MRIAILSGTDQRGGAGRAAFRLMEALDPFGLDMRMMVLEKASGRADVEQVGGSPLYHRLRKVADRLPVLMTPNGPRLFWDLNFSSALPRGGPRRRVNEAKPDVVHLHWVNYGLISPEAIARIEAPIVWTLHDMWPLTGGCHYSGECERFLAACGSCPVLGTRGKDLSSRLWQRKHDAWRGKQFTIVSPSRWLADCARRSSLFRDMPIEVIPNPLDLTVFRPHPKPEARRRLGLPEDVPIIMFGGNKATQNPLKGFHHLRAALADIAAGSGPPPHVAIFGSSESDGVEIGLPTHYLGSLRGDDTIASAYSAADVFVLPSEQDNLPNTVAESLACGTPVVGFRIGGVPDMVRDGESGFLAEPFNTGEFAEGILKALAIQAAGDALSVGARRVAEEMFMADTVARRYLAVYQSAIARARSARGNDRQRADRP